MPFIDFISKINNIQVDNAKNFEAVMAMYNLIEYSGSCLETSESIRQHYRDEPALDNNDNIVKSYRETPLNFHQKNIKIAVPLKY